MRITVPAVCAALLMGNAASWSAPAAHRVDGEAMAATRVRVAGSAGGGWSAPQCGREPVAPQIDTSTVQRYNASVDQVTAYDQAARSYNACVSRQATAEQTTISNDARARIDAIQAGSSGVQKRIAGNFAALAEALRRGVPRSGAR